MTTYKLIDKRRKPVYYCAVSAIILSTGGTLIFLLPEIVDSNTFRAALIVVFAIAITAGYFIIGNPEYYKKDIGRISYNSEAFLLEKFGDVEKYTLDEIIDFDFDINGYKGQNTKSLFEAMLAIVNVKGKTGLKNYFTFSTTTSKHKVELILPNKKSWHQLKEIEQNYKIKKASS